MKQIMKQMLIHNTLDCESWVIDNSIYLVKMGSIAYNISGGSSDKDIYGIVIPPMELLYPYSSGFISGFDPKPQQFIVYDKSHVKHNEDEYDFAIYNISHYFRLLMDNNPNIIDSLYVPERCIEYIDSIGSHIRTNRSLFLSKNVLPKMRGYSFSQKKLVTKPATEQNKYKSLYNIVGYNTKAASHMVRLLPESEDILMTGDLDLEKHAKFLRAIRNGEMELDFIMKWSEDKLLSLEQLYSTSSLRDEPDFDSIRNILLECLDMKYGKVTQSDIVYSDKLLNEMKSVIVKYEKILGDKNEDTSSSNKED